MRSATDRRAALELHHSGLNVCEIGRRLSVPRTTVRDWIKPRYTPKRVVEQPCLACGHERHDFSSLPTEAYSYLLGMYLGDGVVSKSSKRCFRLRIVLDARYPAIIADCRDAMQAIVPGNVVAVAKRRDCAAVEVSASSRQWPCLLPQAGAGPKHHRRIVLADWQLAHTTRAPELFIRGLIQSDGCRSVNTIRSEQRGEPYHYARYLFSNRSEDLKRIYTFHLNHLGIDWRPMGRWNISVARRASVAALDAFVGPKR